MTSHCRSRFASTPISNDVATHTPPLGPLGARRRRRWQLAAQPSKAAACHSRSGWPTIPVATPHPRSSRVPDTVERRGPCFFSHVGVEYRPHAPSVADRTAERRRGGHRGRLIRSRPSARVAEDWRGNALLCYTQIGPGSACRARPRGALWGLSQVNRGHSGFVVRPCHAPRLNLHPEAASNELKRPMPPRPPTIRGPPRPTEAP